MSGDQEIYQLPHNNQAITKLFKLIEDPFSKKINSRTKKIQKVIEEGADVNAKDQKHWSMLNYVIFNGDHEAAKMLLDAGSNVNVSYSRKDASPMIFHVDNLPMFKLFLKYQPKHIPLEEIYDRDGDTILHNNCKFNGLDFVNLLIENALIDPNCLNKEGLTPLQVTIQSEDNEPNITRQIILKLLKRSGLIEEKEQEQIIAKKYLTQEEINDAIAQAPRFRNTKNAKTQYEDNVEDSTLEDINNVGLAAEDDMEVESYADTSSIYDFNEILAKLGYILDEEYHASEHGTHPLGAEEMDYDF